MKYILLCLFLLACQNTNTTCGIQECHGLDLSCGENVPEECNLLYQAGDFCREFINCEQVNNECLLTEQNNFEECKNCMQECINSGMNGIDCDTQCRSLFLVSSEDSCNAQGGEWKLFSNGCADFCGPERALKNEEQVFCTMATINSCECGPTQCWTGMECEKT